jgi:medium-chain acyl-[acyl-carrier-protein] hydrolase
MPMATVATQCDSEISRWLLRFRSPPSAPRLRLFCFPYAGGGASAFGKWPPHLLPGVELIGIQLPGRESRLSDPLVSDLGVLVTEIVAAIRPLLDRPCLFFGHSLGAILAFEVAKRLRGEGFLRGLFASGCAAPHLRSRQRWPHDLPAADFIAAVKAMNGTPREVFDCPELMELVLPALRSDFGMIDAYRCEPGPLLDVPIHCLAGDAEHEISEAQRMGWQAQTTARPFSVTTFRGDHFFVHSARDDVIHKLNEMMEEVIQGGGLSLASAQG